MKNGKREPVVIRLTCITPEQKDLLEKLCDEYEKLFGQGSIYTLTSPYSVLYWACRYSGLVKANDEKTKD